MNRITLTEINGLWYAEHSAGAWAWAKSIETAVGLLKAK
tara:strand:+ start:2879 stop:2995 length:117 start_codon:yes stop_codon:yes gene_type:complete